MELFNVPNPGTLNNQTYGGREQKQKEKSRSKTWLVWYVWDLGNTFSIAVKENLQQQALGFDEPLADEDPYLHHSARLIGLAMPAATSRCERV